MLRHMKQLIRSHNPEEQGFFFGPEPMHCMIPVLRVGFYQDKEAWLLVPKHMGCFTVVKEIQ